LPADRPRPPVQGFSGAQIVMPISERLLRLLRGFSTREGLTLFMTSLTGFAALLSRYTGQEDLLVGMPVANRSSLEVEGLIGAFLNTLVVRVDLSANPSFQELAARVRAS